MIRITPIRVIGADGEQIGVIETSQALKMAESQGFDLVEISPDARPPVCKIMDYGKFKYETSKNEGKNKNKASEMKEVRLGRSVKIDPHDIGIRINQARKFLCDGHKVLVTQRFKGREMAHRELGIAHLRQFRDQLADIAKCESEPRFMGPQASIVLAPDKAKVEAYKRAQAKLNPKKNADKGKGKDGKEGKDGKDGKPGEKGTGKPGEKPGESEELKNPLIPPGLVLADGTVTGGTAVIDGHAAEHEDGIEPLDADDDLDAAEDIDDTLDDEDDFDDDEVGDEDDADDAADGADKGEPSAGSQPKKS